MEKATCWLCKEPYDFDIGKDLGPGTLDAIMRGVRRVRYLQHCKKCCKLTIARVYSAKTEGSEQWRAKLDPVMLEKWLEENQPKLPTYPEMPEANPERNWASLKRKHMYLMGGRCQICDRRDKTVTIYRKSKRRPDRTPLQRDTIALCFTCHGVIGYRLAMAKD